MPRAKRLRVFAGPNGSGNKLYTNRSVASLILAILLIRTRLNRRLVKQAL